MKRICLDDAFAPTPAAFSSRVDETLCRVKSAAVGKKRTRLRLALVAAAILLLALTSAAFATGTIQSIFRSMVRPKEEATVDFEALDDLAQEDAAEVRLRFEGAAEPLAVEMTQSYYDAEQIMLGVRFRAPEHPAQMGFGPDDPQFHGLTIENDTLGALKSCLTEEEYAAFAQAYREKGAAGVTWYRYELGDGFALEDGTSLGGKVNADEAGMPGETRDFFYASDAPLPDAARGLNEVTVVLNVYQTPVFRYMDQTGGYVGYGRRQALPVRFAIRRVAEAGATRWANAEFEDYAARIALTATPVDTHVTVRLAGDKRWDDSWEGEDGRIYNYQMLADGAPLNGELSESSGDGARAGVYAPLPENVKTVILRPIYSRVDERGRWTAEPNPGEDVSFDMTLRPDAEPPTASADQAARPEALPDSGADWIGRAAEALCQMGFCAAEALEGVQWSISDGSDMYYDEPVPVVHGEYRDAGGPADQAPAVTYYRVWFAPDTRRPYLICARTLGPGHTNGNATFGGELSEKAFARWDVIIAGEKWTRLAEDWLRRLVVGKNAQLKHLGNSPGGGNYFGYQTHYVKVRFQEKEGKIHQVTVNPDTGSIVEYGYNPQ